jgi:acetyl-CoA C-acetyltransferase
VASGIKDKVAILGMGCAKFGERWNDDADSLMVEAFSEAMTDAGIDTSQIDAAWLSVGFDAMNIGPSGIPAAMALRLPNIAVTKVENYCASGTEAFRGAVYAVASGAADIALAIGVEKLKDVGYGGLPVRTRGTMFDMVGVVGSAPEILPKSRQPIAAATVSRLMISSARWLTSRSRATRTEPRIPRRICASSSTSTPS